MNKTIILVFMLIISISSFGQITNESELTGKWEVAKILEKPSDPEFKPLIDGFEKSIFIFKENRDFELITTNSSELFKMMMTEVLNGTKWKFVKDKQLIKIGNQEDGYTAMGILINKNNENLLFHIDESGLTFQMKKTE
ncbi:hypothetical protein [Sinomicrobium sp. M5D2P9]